MEFNLNKKMAALALAAFVGIGANSAAQAAEADRETIAQVALLQSLAQGYFRGTITVGELRAMGDTGIGTFEGLNGEMIALDGVVYQALGDGRVVVASDDTVVPFANVTFFDKEIPVDIRDVKSKADLERELSYALKYGNNDFFMVKLHTEFSSVLFRSEYASKEPYPTLVEALKDKQTEFTEKNIKGTLVGLYCPSYMAGLNSPGWHFHFISDDKKKGGHILELSIKNNAIAYLDQTEKFTMVLPRDKKFSDLNLAKDMSSDIRSAEQDAKGNMKK